MVNDKENHRLIYLKHSRRVKTVCCQWSLLQLVRQKIKSINQSYVLKQTKATGTQHSCTLLLLKNGSKSCKRIEINLTANFQKIYKLHENIIVRNTHNHIFQNIYTVHTLQKRPLWVISIGLSQ